MWLLRSVAIIMSMFAISSRAFRMARAPSTHGRGMALAMKKEAPANPVALVTGAARGIGRAISVKLAESGCKVIVNYVSDDAQAQAVVEELKAIAGPRGGGAIALKADCSNPDQVQAMFAKAVEEVCAPISYTLTCLYSTFGCR
jgi:shikimate 5-dehydrogenase